MFGSRAPKGQKVPPLTPPPGPDNRTYAQKARDYAAAAEKWQGQVLARERAAEREAIPTWKASGDPTDHLPYYTNQVLALDKFWYGRAISNRNACQTQAQMYAMLAIMESLQPTDRAVLLDGVA